jgi:hypothetical protein
MHPSMHFKAALAAAVTAVLTLGPATAASATSDTTAPVLHSIALDAPGPFTAGDSVSMTWIATDDSGIMQTQVRLVDAVGKEHVLVGGPGAGTGSVDIDSSWANGPVSVSFITVFDNNSNVAWYFPNGTVQNQPGGSGTHSIDFAALSFSTVDTGADVTPPTLESVSLLTPGPLTAGDTLTIGWQATDDSSGAGYLQALFIDSAGKQHALGGSDVPQASTTIGPSWANGPVHLQEIVLEDRAGNRSVYEADGSATYTPEGAGPATHDIDFSALDFDTVDTGADTTPPQLNSISLASPGPFGDGDTVTYDLDATDDSGIYYVTIDVGDAANKSHQFFSEGAATTSSLTIDPSWGLGKAHVESITLQDVNGNSAEYLWDGRLVNSPGGTTTQTVDFDALSFDVVDGPPRAAIDEKPAKSADSSVADFGFSATDPYDAPASLEASCTVDSKAAPCGSGRASLTGLHEGMHSFAVHVTDPRGNVDDASYTWRVDTVAPLPSIGAFAHRFALGRTVSVVLSNSDAGSGVATSDVRYRSAGVDGTLSSWRYPAAWQHTTSGRLTGPSMRPGRTYCFQTRARDVAGNISAWSARRCVARVIDDPALTLSGGWTRRTGSGYLGGTVSTTSTRGAVASLPTTQSWRLALVATTCPTCGRVVVEVAGVRVGIVSLYAATTHRRTLIVLPAVASRSGRLAIRVVSRSARVEIDGVGLSTA